MILASIGQTLMQIGQTTLSIGLFTLDERIQKSGLVHKLFFTIE